MAEYGDSVFFDVEHILNEEQMAELWFEEEEEMQDAGFWGYESEDDNMDGSQDKEQQQSHSEGEVDSSQMQQQPQQMPQQPPQMQQQPQQMQQQIVCRKQLPMQKKRQIVDAILVKMNNGILPRGHLKQLSTQFNVHKSTITRIFTDIKKQLAEGDLIDTERSYAGALKISHSTVHNLKRRGRLRTHTACNKPTLSSDHKVARLRWILSHINPFTGNQDPTFVDMRNVIHCDEKWFYLNPDKRRFYLLPSEEDPYMAVQSR
ncbi:uncharacterized protein LOC110727013 [Chenopodium quinoa]|uniref:uncharacterized protein LOC110727013 n=1 Tax=Chenopodium quinoa TaxID=63459 RepID=UPI000B774220|nr:uncharacterized protein LOC110727013 [Chenopodium quinoa]